MAAGNKHLGYKAALNEVEEQQPRDQARLLLRLPRPGGANGSPAGTLQQADGLAAVRARAARRRTGEVCAFCRLVERRRPASSRWRCVLRARRRTSVSRTLRAGEQVLLARRQERRLPGHPRRGRRVPLPRRRRAPRRPDRPGRGRHRAEHATAPATPRCARRCRTTCSKMPRGAQVIYPKDLGPILLLADIYPGRPGARVGRRVRARCRRPCSGPAPTSWATSSARTSPSARRKNVEGFLGAERRRPLAGRGARHLRGHRRAPTSTGSCSTCPSRGGWCRTLARGAAPRRDPRGLHAARSSQAAQLRASARRRARSASPRPSRCCTAPGTSRARRCAPTTAWWPTPASSPPPACSARHC